MSANSSERKRQDQGKAAARKRAPALPEKDVADSLKEIYRSEKVLKDALARIQASGYNHEFRDAAEAWINEMIGQMLRLERVLELMDRR